MSISYKGATGVLHGAITEVFGQAHSYTACATAEEVSAKVTV